MFPETLKQSEMAKIFRRYGGSIGIWGEREELKEVLYDLLNSRANYRRYCIRIRLYLHWTTTLQHNVVTV